MNRLPRAVIVLGTVSLLMDVASEMLYPVGPLYLTTVLGASMAWVGLIEGVAEAVSGLSKGFFGALSDARGRRRPFITLGYTLSALSKPLPAILASTFGVLGSRIADRVGKGIRTAPRDALLASYTDATNRGAAFGLHRAMDTVGAAIGPVIALLYLTWNPGDYHTLFYLAFIPALLAAAATLTLSERRFTPTSGRAGIAASFRFRRDAPPQYRRLLLWLTLFAVVNSSDAFLILRARGAGFTDTTAIAAYMGYNLLFALAAYPAGRLSDRFGRKPLLVTGLVLYAVAYTCFAVNGGTTVIWAGFAVYGLYAALTEGIAKAWISDMVPNESRGLAIGLQATLASLGALVASIWTGLLWSSTGPALPLLIAAGTALAAAVGLAVEATLRKNVPGTPAP